MANKNEHQYYDLIENFPTASMDELVLPGMTNGHGTLFGGKALEMMDKAAAIVALRHARKAVVTAHMDSVSFVSPIEESEIVEVIARLISVGGSSMQIEVEVWGEDPLNGKRERCTKATLTMVAIDEEGKPAEVRSLFAGLTNNEQQRIDNAIGDFKTWQKVVNLMYADGEFGLSIEIPERFVIRAGKK
jgi:acyl-CoA hydrolase